MSALVLSRPGGCPVNAATAPKEVGGAEVAPSRQRDLERADPRAGRTTPWRRAGARCRAPRYSRRDESGVGGIGAAAPDAGREKRCEQTAKNAASWAAAVVVGRGPSRTTTCIQTSGPVVPVALAASPLLLPSIPETPRAQASAPVVHETDQFVDRARIHQDMPTRRVSPHRRSDRGPRGRIGGPGAAPRRGSAARPRHAQNPVQR